MNKRYILRGILVSTVLGLVTGRLMARSGDGLTKGDSSSINRVHSEEVEPGRFFNLKKVNSPAAVSSISGEEMYKTPSVNLANTLLGRLPGLTIKQVSGEPVGTQNLGDVTLMGIRGRGSYGYTGNQGYNTYKIFVDGFETNINYFADLSPAEIESVSVLKDAAALATFGMRGANGVIWVITKRGKIAKSSVQFQTRTGMQRAVNINKPLGSYDYANLYNQAISNDNGGIWTPKYANAQLQAYNNGTGINVNWYDQVLKRSAPYTDADLIFSGGDSTAKYNVVLDYANQQGLYDVPNGDATSNIMLKRYNLRTNLDFKMFKIFEARVDLGGRIEDRKMPNISTGDLWNNMARYPSNIYNVKDTVGGLDNWSGTALYPNNPLASVNALGWSSRHYRILQGNFGLKENLSFITPGLYLQETFSFNSYTASSYNKTATYARYFNGLTTTTDKTSPIAAGSQDPAGQEDWKQAAVTIGYERQFGDHHLKTAVNYHQSDYRGDGGVYSFKYHYQNLSGRANYTYKDRYIAEFGFSYFGADAYAPGNQWGFYPALSAAWIISNESFLQNSPIVSSLKLRASAGKTGSSDAFGDQNGRFLYQQYYYNGSNTGSFYTGNAGPTYANVLNPVYIANSDVFAEKSMKYNMGADLTLLKVLDINLDIFLDKRSNILTIDNSFMDAFGYNTIFKNLGKVTNKGIEATAAYSDKTGALGYSIFGTVSFAKNKIDYMAEVPPAYSYNSYTGRPIGTPVGLIATGFYQLSDFNANGSLKSGIPVPQFGAVQPGDIKYQDLNNDNKIDQTDVTSLGKPAYPELTYSFGANISYKGFDLSTFLQGTHGSTVDILSGSTVTTQALVNNGNVYEIAKGAWAYYPDQGIDTRATATYPRLTTVGNTNNYTASSFWIKSGDFLKIRNIELGYTFATRLINSVGLNKVRIYINAVNPVTWSPLLKDYNMDPEALTGYPGLKSINAGFSVTF